MQADLLHSRLQGACTYSSRSSTPQIVEALPILFCLPLWKAPGGLSGLRILDEPFSSQSSRPEGNNLMLNGYQAFGPRLHPFSCIPKDLYI